MDDHDLHEILYYGVIQSKTTGNIIDFKFDGETKTVQLADPEETEFKYGLLRLIINKQSKEIVSIGFVQEEEELVTACKNDIVSIGSVPEQAERVTTCKQKWQPETTPCHRLTYHHHHHPTHRLCQSSHHNYPMIGDGSTMLICLLI